jgi:hypothetical protein
MLDRRRGEAAHAAMQGTKMRVIRETGTLIFAPCVAAHDGR